MLSVGDVPREGAGNGMRDSELLVSEDRVVDCHVSPWTRRSRSRSAGCDVTCATSQFRDQVQARIKPRRRCTSVKIWFAKQTTQLSTRDLCSVCWTEHIGGVRSTRTFKLVQALLPKRGGLQQIHFIDEWIEHLMCRRYVEATKEVREQQKERKQSWAQEGI